MFPLLAGYLSLVIMAALGSVSAISAEITASRIQGLADATVLYAHDKSQVKGISNQPELQSRAMEFLRISASGSQLRVSKVNAVSRGSQSDVTLCVIWSDPLGSTRLGNIEICRTATAKSFLLF